MANCPLPRWDPRDQSGDMSDMEIRMSMAMSKFLRHIDWASMDNVLVMLQYEGFSDVTKIGVLAVIEKSYSKDRPRFENVQDKGGVQWIRSTRTRSDQHRRHREGPPRPRHGDSGTGGKGGYNYDSSARSSQGDRQWDSGKGGKGGCQGDRQWDSGKGGNGGYNYDSSAGDWSAHTWRQITLRDGSSLMAVGDNRDTRFFDGTWKKIDEDEPTCHIEDGQWIWFLEELPYQRIVEVIVDSNGTQIWVENMLGTLRGTMMHLGGDMYERVQEEQAAGSRSSAAVSDATALATAPPPEPSPEPANKQGVGNKEAGPWDGNDAQTQAAAVLSLKGDSGYVVYRALQTFPATDGPSLDMGNGKGDPLCEAYISLVEGELFFARLGSAHADAAQCEWTYGMKACSKGKGWFPTRFAKRLAYDCHGWVIL